MLMPKMLLVCACAWLVYGFADISFGLLLVPLSNQAKYLAKSLNTTSIAVRYAAKFYLSKCRNMYAGPSQ